MSVFDKQMSDHQTAWREKNCGAYEPGRQNGRQRDWILPKDRIEDGLWLDNARAANAAARELARAAAGRLLHPVEANEVFLALSADERAALRVDGSGAGLQELPVAHQVGDVHGRRALHAPREVVMRLIYPMLVQVLWTLVVSVIMLGPRCSWPTCRAGSSSPERR